MKQLIKIFVLAIFTYSGTQAQTVEEVVEKHIQALGGKDKLRQLKSARIEAVVVVNSFEVKSTTTVFQNRGIRTEQDIQGMKIIQGFDGTTAWMINPMMGDNKPIKLPLEQNASLKNQMDLTGLFDYKAKGYDISLKGEEVLNGTPVYVLTVKMPDGSNADNYISKNNYHTLKTTVTVLGADGKETQTNIYSSDYKEVDGYVTPYTIEIEGGGLPGRITTKVTSARFNVDTDPSIFAFPGEQ